VVERASLRRLASPPAGVTGIALQLASPWLTQRGVSIGGVRPAQPPQSAAQTQGDEAIRRALAIAVTWLYRRHNWAGLTEDGRTSEAAPEDIWAREKYRQLGVPDLAFEPPDLVPVEPGFAGSGSARRTARESEELHRLLGQGWGKYTSVSQAGMSNANAQEARTYLDQFSRAVREELRKLGIDESGFDEPVEGVEGMHYMDRPVAVLRIKLERLEQLLQ
jgi:hypothetical protein